MVPLSSTLLSQADEHVIERGGLHRSINDCNAFAGQRSDHRRHRTAALYTLIETAKLNRIDPQAWLADVLARLPDHPARRIDDLLPWNWTEPQPRQIAA